MVASAPTFEEQALVNPRLELHRGRVRAKPAISIGRRYAQVVEIWPPSTGDYDLDEILPEFMARGDLECWRLQPFARELKAWRRRDDGTYEEHRFTGGEVRSVTLPGVVIGLDGLSL